MHALRAFAAGGEVGSDSGKHLFVKASGMGCVKGHKGLHLKANLVVGLDLQTLNLVLLARRFSAQRLPQLSLGRNHHITKVLVEQAVAWMGHITVVVACVCLLTCCCMHPVSRLQARIFISELYVIVVWGEL
jgi:hypothetical protein